MSLFFNSLKDSLRKYLVSDSGYKLIGSRISRSFGYISNYINYYRSEQDQKKKIRLLPEKHKIDDDAISRITLDMVVLHGPFKGLKYPKLSTLDGIYIRGPILAKMLGCYEKEIHPVIEHLCSRIYSEIVNIGSAEGYYTIGLALRFPHAKNIAFDIDPKARELCFEIAKLNGVEKNVIIDSYCSHETLANFSFTGKGLIISDCEGYEQELFNEAVVKNIRNCDVLIELHDFADPNIYPTLHALFKNTHTEKLISSISDAQKIREYNYPELKGLNPETIEKIVSEHRPHQEWLFLESKVI